MGYVLAQTGHRHLMFLHGLQKGRLGLGAGAVDFVGHQKLGENRSLDEAEYPLAGGVFFENLRAGDIIGHQVGGELDALVIKPHNGAEGLDQAGFRYARYTDQEGVTARQKGDQCVADDIILAENDLASGVVDFADFGAGGFDPFDDIFVGLADCAHDFEYKAPFECGKQFRAKISHKVVHWCGGFNLKLAQAEPRNLALAMTRSSY